MTDAFPSIDGGLEQFELSEEAVQSFERDGYLVGLDVLSEDEVAELRRRLESIGERILELEPRLYEIESSWIERPDDVVLHFLGAWRVDELFHDLVFHPAITVPLAQLLGVDRLRFWHDQVFWKPAKHPGVVPWHQDYSYWTRTAPAQHVTMFVTLDDMSPENGGLEYVPGSHEWGLFPAQSFGGDLDQLSESLTSEQRDRFLPEPVVLKAGQGAIHHSHTVHGSRANPSDRPRRAAVLNYMAPDTRVADDSGPLLRGVERIAKGEIVEGAFFPIALDRTKGA